MNERGHKPYGAPDDEYSGPKRALILAGGGMRVAYQAGVIRALIESGLRFVHADGTSGGTINLAMLFSGLSPTEMCDRWRTLKVHDFVHFMPFEAYLKVYDMLAMGTADGIINSVFPHLGIDVSSINAAQGMLGTFNVCNYTRKTNEVITHDTIDLDLLIAGISLPIFMPPVPKKGNLYVDSVWIKDANLTEAVKRGAEELWVVWCIGNTGEYKTGAFNQYVHMIELSANGKLFEEFEYINELNSRIVRGEEAYGQTRPIKLHLIKPFYPLPLDPDLYLGRIDTATLIDMGYADAIRYLVGMHDEGLPFSPEVTKMQNDKAGIAFHESMTGPFAPGETDPPAGAAKGKAAGTTLSITCAINIHDLDRFIADPDHYGDISGQVSFTPFEENMPAKSGVFNLFSPTDDPTCKLMVYELAFAHDGQDYYLAGRKEVRNDPVYDLWRDTTTLYTTLHQGTDRSGPIVGAGILTIDMAGFLKMLASINVTSAHSVANTADTLFHFGRFFLGELWDTYGPAAKSQ
jgi:predicted acylesterase/phospholipase RssA